MSRQSTVMPSTFGGMSLNDFDAFCRRVTIAMATNNRQMAESGNVQSHNKDGYDGTKDTDVFTDADASSERLFKEAAQEIPISIGYLGEEGLVRECTLNDYVIIITVDPLDGTRAYQTALRENRLPRPGEVSSMLGVLVGRRGDPTSIRSVAGYICDVADGTLYSLKPGGSHVERTQGATTVDMARLPRATAVGSGRLFVHQSMRIGAPEPCNVTSNVISRRLMLPISQGGVFCKTSLNCGSLGLKVMSVFNGEFAAMMRVGRGFSTPWDEAPLQAMCRFGHVSTFAVRNTHLQQVVISDGTIDHKIDRVDDIVYLPDDLVRSMRRSNIRVNTL